MSRSKTTAPPDAEATDDAQEPSTLPAKILGAELGGRVPPGFESLDQAALQQLAGAVREARRLQKADIAAALNAALGQVPALLRGPLKKILLPEGRL